MLKNLSLMTGHDGTDKSLQTMKAVLEKSEAASIDLDKQGCGETDADVTRFLVALRFQRTHTRLKVPPDLL